MNAAVPTPVIPSMALSASGTLPGATDPASGGLLGWELVDLPLFICLPVLLILSGFFSGSETALFGLSQHQRMMLRQRGSLAGHAVDALLADRRMLLITVLLGNTVINVLYFVISSVLIMRSSAPAAGEAAMAVGFLLAIVLLGEIAPKVLAAAQRRAFAAFIAPPLLTLHRAIGPLRAGLAHGVIAPLSRLAAPHHPPMMLGDDELRSLVEVSQREGVIDTEEHRILGEVLKMRRLKVRDVMTPRVRMTALPRAASREDVMALMRETRLTKVPVHDGDLDHILGILHVKRYIMDRAATSVTDRAVMTPAHFVPDLITLDQLLDQLRRVGAQSAIVVDEYGGTEGIVSVEDVVEELVGDIVAPDDEAAEPPRLIGLGAWRISGEMGVHEWAEAFDVPLEETRVATVGGLITERLGRAPEPGDALEAGPVRLEVETVEQSRVVTVLVALREEGEGDDSDAEAGEEGTMR
ncbi:MAG: hemolysin family protein [Planctomycetota bacterium]|nr:hemolysin family protein [Planctomycetota bacterium]